MAVNDKPESSQRCRGGMANQEILAPTGQILSFCALTIYLASRGVGLGVSPSAMSSDQAIELTLNPTGKPIQHLTSLVVTLLIG